MLFVLMLAFSFSSAAQAVKMVAPFGSVPLAHCILAPDSKGFWWSSRFKFRVCVGDHVVHTTFAGGFKAEVLAINRLDSQLLLKFRDNTEAWARASSTWLEIKSTGFAKRGEPSIVQQSYVERIHSSETPQVVRHIYLKRPGEILLQLQDCLTGSITLADPGKYKPIAGPLTTCPAQQTHVDVNDDNMHF